VLSALTPAASTLNRQSFASWNDADPAFLRAICCLIRHARAARVVETGVAHGATSPLILEATQRRRPKKAIGRSHGGLRTKSTPWSHCNAMVAADFGRSSRRRLSPLLRQAGCSIRS
jgi:hypothetical protein